MFDIIFTIKELIARFIEYGIALLSSLHNFEPINRTICKFLTAVNRVRSETRLTLERVVVLIGTTVFLFDSSKPKSRKIVKVKLVVELQTGIIKSLERIIPANKVRV